MIYISQKGQPYWYKVHGVRKGTSAKGVPYTFIKISSKDKKSGEYHNCTLTAWEDIDVKENDSVAIYGIDKADYSISESGFKTYTELQLGITNIKVKPAEADKTQTSDKSNTTKKPSASSNKKAPTDEELYGGDNEDLPF